MWHGPGDGGAVFRRGSRDASRLGGRLGTRVVKDPPKRIADCSPEKRKMLDQLLRQEGIELREPADRAGSAPPSSTSGRGER